VTNSKQAGTSKTEGRKEDITVKERKKKEQRRPTRYDNTPKPLPRSASLVLPYRVLVTELSEIGFNQATYLLPRLWE
jgi:hypothetical protein